MISRVWFGPELEGYDKGKNTLFVEGLVPKAGDIIKLYHEATEKTGKRIDRIYLGAGGIGLTEVVNFSSLSYFCLTNSVKLVAEIMAEQLPLCEEDILYSCEIILTLKGNKSNRVNYLKIDDYKHVSVFKLNEYEVTDLSDLDNGMFSQDVLIYERK